MVNRFLMWRLPESFGPDNFISFRREQALASNVWPVGTNLFSYEEAKAMLEHVLMVEPPVLPQTGWLVEMQVGRLTLYLSYGCGHLGWSVSPDQATRYARQQDAAAVAATLRDDDVNPIAVEHQWG